MLKLVENNIEINKYCNLANQNLIFKALNYQNGLISETIFDLLIELTDLSKYNNCINIYQYENSNVFQAHHYCLSEESFNSQINLERFKKLISNGLRLDTPVNNTTGCKCIHLATSHGYESINFVDYILIHDFNELFSVDNNNNNVIHYAIKNLN